MSGRKGLFTMGEGEAFTIEIDGKSCAAEAGELLYEVARRNGVFIPSLCRSELPRLFQRASCRLCIVELEQDGRTRVVASCSHPVAGPCTVRTDTDRIRRERAMLLALLRAKAPEATALAQMDAALGDVSIEGLAGQEDGSCIACGACAEACRVYGAQAIAMLGSGTGKRSGAPFDLPPKPCIGCLSCAKACPVDAIPFSEDAATRTVWGRVFSLEHCERCGKPIGTAALRAHLLRHSHAGEPPMLCDACRGESFDPARSGWGMAAQEYLDARANG